MMTGETKLPAHAATRRSQCAERAPRTRAAHPNVTDGHSATLPGGTGRRDRVTGDPGTTALVGHGPERATTTHMERNDVTADAGRRVSAHAAEHGGTTADPDQMTRISP
ncbi:hypothetical protein VZT92_027979 [Zoarces viviparus]|uniref:Uncharacterized protein n=1 Tax=Zoarces viviparus TaxID=48416 RepID=A0AAW1DWL8_ZOAVI